MAIKGIVLDLKQFKHVASDDKSTTLQHKLGHTLTLAHKSLSPENQKQLEALSKMAKAEVEPGDRGEKASDKQQGLAQGGRVKMAEGGDTSYLKGMEKATTEDSSVGDTLKKGWDNLTGSTPEPSASPKPASGGHYKSGVHGDEYAQGGKVRMADGGDVDPSQMMSVDPDIAARQQAQSLTQSLDSQPTPQTADVQAQKDLYNQKLAGAGVVTSADDMFGPNGEAPRNPVNPTVWGQVENSTQAQQLASQQLAERGKIQASNDSTRQQQSQHDQAVAQNIVNAKLGIPLVPDPGAPQVREPAQAPVGDKLPETPPPGMSQPEPANPQGAKEFKGYDPEGMLASGYNKQMAGIADTAKAQGALGQQQAAVFNTQALAQKEAQDHYQNQYQELERERQGHMDDIKNGYIDPNQYWTGHKDPATGEMVGGHSKIAAAIGILIAGFNPTSSPNAAMNMLQYQMNQNIEAQRQNLGAKNNLLSANLQQFGNMRDATMMTRIMQNDIVSAQLGQAAAQAQNPLAAAAAKQAQGQLQVQTAPLFQQFAMRRAMMSLANSPNGGNPQAIDHMLGYMRVMNPEMAKEMESRYIPGVGLGSVPVPPEVRTKLVGFQNTSNLITDLQNFVKHNSTVLPGTPAYNVGAQKALMLQSAIREGQLGTVYKAGEQPLLDKFVSSNPAGALKMIQTTPQLKALLETNQAQMNLLKKNYGLPSQQMSMPADNSHQAALAWANANPKDPRAIKIKQLIGK